MDDIAEFLSRHPPFDTMDAGERAALAEATGVEAYAAGALVIAQGAAPSDAFRVVRSGAVDLLDGGRAIDRLGEGAMFGHASLLSGLPAALDVRAAEDSVVYRIPAPVLEPLLMRTEGMSFVVRSLHASRWLEDARLASGADPIGGRVASLVQRAPVVCSPQDTIREVAERMGASGQSAAVVSIGDGRFGILTDGDLRRRVVAAARMVDDPVSSVMTAPAFTVDAEQPASTVLLEMLERDIAHLPVVDATGELLGVVSDNDILAVERRTPFRLRSAVHQATTIEAVQAAARQLPDSIVGLWDARVAPATIGETASVVVDALTRRLVDLAVAEAGEPPTPFAWLALGSHARREFALSSDLDSALAWQGEDTDPGLMGYVRGVARRVVEAQAGAGFPACDKGAVASNPLFSRSIDAWREVAASWLEDPDQESALILVSVVVDARPVWAPHEAAGLPAVFREAREHPRLLRGLLRLALSHRPPTGFRRDIVVEQSGEHRGRLDIKSGGLLPIADIARYAGMAAGVAGASTRERLRAAAAAGTLDDADAQTLEEAFDLFSALRLEHQVEQVRAGVRPDDFLDPARLNTLNRTYLGDAFKAVAATQKAIEGTLARR
jgi:CBS domain-containing protein